MNKGNKIRKTLAVVIAVAMLATTMGCTKTDPTPVSTVEKEGVLIETSAPRSGDIHLETSYMGRTEAKEMVVVVPKLQAEIDEIYVTVGQEVTKGDLLAKQDDEAIQDQMAMAKLQYDLQVLQNEQATGSKYQNSMNSLNSAYDSSRNAYEDAKDEVKRTKIAINQLYQDLAALEAETPRPADYEARKGMITANLVPLEMALPQLEMAEEFMRDNYTNAKQAYTTNAVDGKEELEATLALNLEMATKAYENTKKQGEYASIEAPISGTIESINITTNNFPEPGKPAMIISNKDAMSIDFGVSGTVASNIAIGDPVTVEINSKDYTGSVMEVSDMIDMQTGLFIISANIDTLEDKLPIGQLGKVTVVSQKSNDTLLISQDAIYYQDGKAYVYISMDGIATKTFVETGISTPEEIEITSGITSDDNVITSWHPNLIDGAKVITAS